MIQDFKYGIRMLLQKPTYTVIAIATLALGIGATTSLFSVVNAVLLRPLPYPNAKRLVHVGQQYRSGLMGAGEPKFLYWRSHAQSFEELAAYSGVGGADGNLSGGDEAEFVRGVRVSAGIFRVLGVYPAIGRTFSKEEDSPGAARVAILSNSLWQRRFGGDKAIIGQSVRLNNKPITIVGVMPADFELARGAHLMLPMQASPTANYDPNATVVGLLKQGVTVAQARDDMKRVADAFRAEFPKQMNTSESVDLQSYQGMFTDSVASWLWILLGAVGFLLLIACANVGNLQLTRAAARQREIAVRIALGAGRMRIIRQLVTEGVLLSLIGGAAGIFLAVWGTAALMTAIPNGFLPDGVQVNLDWRVLLFALAVSIATGVLFGLAPAWQARTLDANTVIKESSGTGGSRKKKLGRILVGAEIALSLVLLVGAGLLLRTFAKLISVDPGFDQHNVFTGQVALGGEAYDTTAEANAFYRSAIDRIRSIPGVETAAVINRLPLDWQFNMPIVFADKPDQLESVQFRMITPDYFKVMHIPVRNGREFADSDSPATAPVAIVNEAFVRGYFEKKDPFAQRFSIGRGLNDIPRQVVGVVADTKQMGLDRPPLATVFVPIAQMPDKLMAVARSFTPGFFTVRTSVDPMSLAAAIKQEIARVDSTVALSPISSMDRIASRSTVQNRFNMILLGLFAVLGLVLAAVGIYGVTSYAVAQRTNEIGLRLALGAQSHSVIAMIVRQGALVVIVGIAIGLIASLILTRLLKSQLFGVTATDPLTFVTIGILLALVALLASWIPARRAARVDPLTALRYE